MLQKKISVPFFRIFLILFCIFNLEGEAFDKPDAMKIIPRGIFLMGADHSKENFQCADYFGNCKGNWYTREEPLHGISINAFYMDNKEVTQGKYFKVMGNNPSSLKGAKLPVTEVTWFEAIQYCKKIGKRLPTEAEWEYAARAGTKYNYYWGQKIGTNNANCDNCGNLWEQREPVAVGNFSPNSWGLYDMSGNVWEWVSDWYDPKYYSKSPRKNPKGPKTGKIKIARGGSWYDTPYFSRHAFRNIFPPAIKSDTLGFRCAKTITQHKDFIKPIKYKNTPSPPEIKTIRRKETKSKSLSSSIVRSKDILEDNTFSKSFKKNRLVNN